MSAPWKPVRNVCCNAPDVPTGRGARPRAEECTTGRGAAQSRFHKHMVQGLTAGSGKG